MSGMWIQRQVGRGAPPLQSADVARVWLLAARHVARGPTVADQMRTWRRS